MTDNDTYRKLYDAITGVLQGKAYSPCLVPPSLPIRTSHVRHDAEQTEHRAGEYPERGATWNMGSGGFVQ